MRILKETLFERLRNRLAPAHAVKTITRLQRASFRSEICYGAVKEASEMLDRYRIEALVAIRAVRRWQAAEAVRDAMRPTREAQGRLLVQQARASATLYLDARRDYHDLVRLSLAHCKQPPSRLRPQPHAND